MFSTGPARASDDWLYSDDWRFTIAPYSWLLSASGDVTVRGVKADIDQNFSDIFKKVDLVLEARLEAHKGDWSFVIDPTFGILSDEADVGPIEVDVDSRVWLVAFGVGRTLYRGPLRTGSDRKLKLEAGIGGILVRLKSEIDFPAPIPDPEFEQTWVDPAITFRATAELDERWRFRLGGLLGGFGIGEASQLSAGLEAYAIRSIGERTSLVFGYRGLFLDYERGSGARKIDAEIAINGPSVGLIYRF